tara:strand:+ start:34 stop:231 length:198 start_codon:yes stop_codon:yes gene_type:complete
MNKILAALNKIAANLVLAKKDKIITQMNKKFNIPFASEAEEKEMLEGLWELLEEAMSDTFYNNVD